MFSYAPKLLIDRSQKVIIYNVTKAGVENFGESF